MTEWNTTKIDGAKIARRRRMKTALLLAIAVIILVSAGIFARVWLSSAGKEFRDELSEELKVKS